MCGCAAVTPDKPTIYDFWCAVHVRLYSAYSLIGKVLTSFLCARTWYGDEKAKGVISLFVRFLVFVILGSKGHTAQKNT
jgi:hypothetical protein